MKSIERKKRKFAKTYVKCNKNIDKTVSYLKSCGENIGRATAYNYLKDPFVSNLINNRYQNKNTLSNDEKQMILAEIARNPDCSAKDRRGAVMDSAKLAGELERKSNYHIEQNINIPTVNKVSLEERINILKENTEGK